MKQPAVAPYNFNFSRKGRSFLISNEFGGWSLIGAADFEKLAAGRISRGNLACELSEKGFAANHMDLEGRASGLSGKLLGGWKGPHVHIIEVTRRCNCSCLYCSAGASALRAPGFDMSIETARKTLDFIFSLKVPSLMLEFQGGEPLLNFRVVRFLIEQAGLRAAASGTTVHFSLVSNLSLLDKAKLDYLVSRKVTVCASLDGPASVHERVRLMVGGSSHKRAVFWLKKLVAISKKDPLIEMPNAICTVSRFSLPHAERIINEFVRIGIMRVQLGPLEPVGRALPVWDKFGYGPKEFLAFYASAFERILELNRQGVPVYEKGALMLIKQVLNRERPRYQNLDLVFRLGYGCDGSIFGSDEGRLIFNSGDDFFKLGAVRKDTFVSILKKPLARAFMLSAFPELNQPSCARCVYSPWCRVMPAYNYLAQRGFWGNMASSERCAVYKGVLDLLFELSLNKKNMAVFRKWDEMYE